MCGYAVEWVRRSYTSQWRLFKDHPEITVPGRYVKLPVDTPHYPGIHNFWSRIWTANGEESDSPLGEVFDASHSYDYGDARGFIPPPKLLGNSDCVAKGDMWPLPVIDRDTQSGWDSRCYQLASGPQEPYIPPIDIEDCHWQQRLIQAIDILYSAGGSAAVVYLQGFLPTATYVSADNNESTVPGFVLIIDGTRVAVLIAGTTNFQQWAGQGMTSVNGLVDYGSFSTLAFWYLNAQRLLGRISTHITFSPSYLIFAGHSYGGVLACLLAARSRLAAPTRRIGCVTYGCPKPGDQRLQNILDTVDQLHFVNVDDAVTFMPPSRIDLGNYAALVPTVVQERWFNYVRNVRNVQLDLAGNRTVSPLPESMFSLMYRLVTQYLTGQPLEVIVSHFSAEYARRIRCPAVPVPSPDPGVVPALWLQGESLVVYPDYGPINQWPDTSLSANDAFSVSGIVPPIKTTDLAFDISESCDYHQYLLPKNKVILDSDWCQLVVMKNAFVLNPGQIITPLFGPAIEGPVLALYADQLGLVWSGGNVYFTVSSTIFRRACYWASSIGGTMTVGDGRTAVGTHANPGGLPPKIGYVGCPTVTFPFPGSIFIYEVVILNGPITTGDALKWANDLCDKYSIV